MRRPRRLSAQTTAVVLGDRCTGRSTDAAPAPAHRARRALAAELTEQAAAVTPVARQAEVRPRWQGA